MATIQYPQAQGQGRSQQSTILQGGGMIAGGIIGGIYGNAPGAIAGAGAGGALGGMIDGLIPQQGQGGAAQAQGAESSSPELSAIHRRLESQQENTEAAQASRLKTLQLAEQYSSHLPEEIRQAYGPKIIRARILAEAQGVPGIDPQDRQQRGAHHG